MARASASADHGTLSGLGDDDHTLYVKEDASGSGVVTNRVQKLDSSGDFSGVLTGGQGGEGHINIDLSTFSVVAGTWALEYAASYYRAMRVQNLTGVADADEITFKAYLEKGTYTVYFIRQTASSYGKVDIEIDGTAIATFDNYSGGDVKLVVGSDASNVIATSGIKTIGVKVNGKNASSSNYYCYMSGLVFVRTA